VRTAGWAGSARAAGRRATGGALKTARRIREATGGVLSITAAVWNAGFH